MNSEVTDPAGTPEGGSADQGHTEPPPTSQVLWKPSPEFRQLRRPLNLRQSAARMAGTNQPMDDIVKTSTLSAEAQEFVPRGFQAPSSGYGGQPLDPSPQQQQAFLHNPYAPFGANQAMVMGPAGPTWTTIPTAGPYGAYMDPMVAAQQQQSMMMAAAVAAQQQEIAAATRNNYVHHHHHPASSNEYRNNSTTVVSHNNSWTSKQNQQTPSSGGSATEQLRSAMRELTMNPGEFDNLVMPLADTMCQWLNEPEVIETVISMVLEQSVSEPNFRYNGARLLNLLNNLDANTSSSFRNLLLERCRQENSTVRELLEKDPRRLHSFTLFLAELFIQLELTKGTGLKISVLGEGLFEDLSMLLSTPNDDNVKCACQVLKLTGMHLEQAVGLESMNNLESQLVAAMESGQLKPNMNFLAQSVINLRRQTWGRSQSSPHPHQPSGNAAEESESTPSSHPWSGGQDSAPQGNHFLNEPVYYGPDGKMLTAEESRFLQDGMAESGGASDGDEYDEGMDEELQAAYEQFLQMAPRST